MWDTSHLKSDLKFTILWDWCERWDKSACISIERSCESFCRTVLCGYAVLRIFGNAGKCAEEALLRRVLHEDVNFSFRTAAKLANAMKMDFFLELKPQDEDGKDAENSDTG